LNKTVKTIVLTNMMFILMTSVMTIHVFAEEASEFTVPEEELSAETYLDMHSYGILQLNSTIQSLGDDEFTHPTSRETLKTEMNEINDLVKQGGFYTAYHKLLTVKEQMDGSTGGIPDDDEIIEGSQGKVLPVVDERLSAFIMSTTPSVGEKKSSPDYTTILTDYGPWVLGAIGLAIIIIGIGVWSVTNLKKTRKMSVNRRLAEDSQSQLKK